MRDKTNRHLGIEVDLRLHYKLKYIAKYEGRSVNSQIIQLIRNCIWEFEKEKGEIEVRPDGKVEINI